MKTILTIVIVSVYLSLPARAHHGTVGQFDATNKVIVSGVISDLAFVNPHSYVYIDVTDESGAVNQWNCELRASSVLRRSGWTPEMFVSGTPVRIEGVMSRRDEHGCYIETISLNGGKPIARYDQLSKAQQETLLVGRSATTTWGDPNIDGDWAAEQFLVGAIDGPTAIALGPDAGAPTGIAGPPPPPGVAMTAASQAYRAKVIAEGDKVVGRLDCQPVDFFSDWTWDQPANRIIQEQDKITLKYGFMDTERVIHLNMDEHPVGIEPSWAGHSIGKWKDGVLVVDTVGFTPFAGNRSTRSGQFHAVERFILNHETGSITREYIGEDPLFWVGEQIGQDVVYLADYPWEPYACDDRSVE